MREVDYYPKVAQWAARELSCFHTATNTGLRLGRIDVVGLRDVGGNLSGRSEVISIEVKHDRQPFATSIGQASGYWIYADRCYLAEARPRPFSEDEVSIARQLGVGLIRITGDQRMRITEILSPAAREPLEALRLELIDRLGYASCTVCAGLFKRGSKDAWGERIVRQTATGTHMQRAVRDEKGLVYWLDEAEERSRRPTDTTYRRRYVCPECIAALFAHLGDLP